MTRVSSADGTAIVIETVGSGPGIVMIDPAGAFHGMRPTADAVDALARSFTVITYDRRGRGSSGDTLPYEVAREVEDVAAVVATARMPVSVLGFSSGAALALHAAVAGIPLRRVIALEPAIDLIGPPDTDFTRRLRTLIAAGRRGDALEHFHTGIGAPPEMISALKTASVWPELEALAHTLIYDTMVTDSLSRDLLACVTLPTVVINSAATDDSLRSMGESVAAAVPGARHVVLPGTWHGVHPDALTAWLLENDRVSESR